MSDGAATQDIDIALLRARVEAAARQARAADLRAAKRGRLLEKLLKTVNGPTYHYLSIQLKPGQEVADILTENEDGILDYFLVPLDEWARAVATEECREALQHISPIWHAIGIARARDLAEQGEDAPSPEPTAGDSPALPADPAMATGGPGSVEPAVRDPGAAPGLPTADYESEPVKRVEATAAAQQRAPHAESASTEAALDEESRAILRAMGAGEFLALPILERVAAEHGTTMGERKQRLYEKLDALESAGLIEKQSIDLRVANRLLKGLGQLAITLAEAGRARYSELTGAEPADGIGPFRDKYKTLEAGVFIRVVRRILEGWNQREDRRWTYEVIDAVWEPDEALARVPGAQRSYLSPDGTRRALPDLIVQMHPRSGQPQLAVVEVERGAYKVAELRDKWERAALCYPPMMIYVVAPNVKTRNRLSSEWRAVIARVAERHGLHHDVAAAFYTPVELEEHGLLSAKQFTGLMYRQKAAREKKTAGQEDLSEEEKSLLRLPRFWNQPKTFKGGDQLELV